MSCNTSPSAEASLLADNPRRRDTVDMHAPSSDAADLADALARGRLCLAEIVQLREAELESLFALASRLLDAQQVDSATTLLAALCWNAASQRLPTVVMGPLIVFETLSGLLWTFIYRQSWPPLLTSIGIGCLIVGVIYAMRIKPQRLTALP